jgi:hypothetical protein
MASCYNHGAGTQSQHADKLAEMLGMRKVGLIFNQSASAHEYIMSDEEVWQACAVHAAVGEHCVIAVFSQLEEDGQVRVICVRAANSHSAGSALATQLHVTAHHTLCKRKSRSSRPLAAARTYAPRRGS